MLANCPSIGYNRRCSRAAAPEPRMHIRNCTSPLEEQDKKGRSRAQMQGEIGGLVEGRIGGAFHSPLFP